MPLLTAGAQRTLCSLRPCGVFFGRPNKPRVEETLNNEVFLGSRRRLHNPTDESVFICSLVHTLVAALLLRATKLKILGCLQRILLDSPESARILRAGS